MLRKWDELPNYMKNDAVRPYYDSLKKKQFSMRFKRWFDFFASVGMIIILSPFFLCISVAIIADSKGGVFFCQERITQYGKKFKIIKFRTMIKDAEKKGSQVTVANDIRITKVGRILRKYRIDEIPQLFNILLGDMSFVGTRPEVEKYVKMYSPEMFATLLLPAGITSEASIYYKDEADLLKDAVDPDSIYIGKVLPEKMNYNLESIKRFSFLKEFGIMLKTVFAVVR